ncbi:hypothetical protein [Streptomyces hainanensis]|uniref:Uncharacterized protein n=1 Tax=Streptomyces hainanensis TaxID=402648 RepID=A0A4R4SVR7_9ACTN|nr:hypothetical protein [Streptomyces hainanensis]TDC68281.1 hypothetical protein E1283_27635 [Streptomyces hainanensis]
MSFSTSGTSPHEQQLAEMRGELDELEELDAAWAANRGLTRLNRQWWSSSRNVLEVLMGERSDRPAWRSQTLSMAPAATAVPVRAHDETTWAEGAGMARWTVGRQEATPPAPGRVGGIGWMAAWLTGAVTLSVEGALALVVFFLVGLRNEHYFAAGAPVFLGYLFGAVIIVIMLGLVGLIGSAAAVLPVVQLSRWSARRSGRAETMRWCLAVCGAVTAAVAVCIGVPTALLGGGWTVLPLVLLVTFLCLVPAVLCARAVTVLRGTGTRFALAGMVLVYGLTLSGVVLIGGLVAYGTGLIQAYEPPQLTDAQLVGTWTDDHGGTLVLRADGTAVANDLDVHTAQAAYDGGAPEPCSGSGSWTQDASPSGTPQLDLSVSGCMEGRDWQFGGTDDQPTLYYWIGDPDSLDQYTLHRMSPAP